MKHIAIILLLLVSTSCMHQPLWATFEVENKTDQNLEILAYSESKLIEVITIDANSVFKRKKDTETTKDDSPSLFDNTAGAPIDSISLILGRERYKIQHCDLETEGSCQDFQNGILYQVAEGFEKNNVKGILRRKYANVIRITFESSYFNDALPLF